MEAIVATPSGALEGVGQRGIQIFRGIPYARPPVGGLRFRTPEPPVPWRGVRSARSFGQAAPQVGPVNRLVRTFIGVADVAQSQDCLYLNVWTPAADSRRRPVLVWLHGGAFIMGSGSTVLYDGARLARRGDVVVVTLNYRLGALGYLNWRSLASGSGDGLPPANLGLRDQIAALEWVRDSIEAFGGDPENVTIFGESAGAMSVGTLLGTPRASGLFHRAILQSGAAHNICNAEQAEVTARRFFENLGVESVSWEVLESLSVTDLMRAQLRTTADLGLLTGILPWQPSIDGDLLPEAPLAALQRGLSASVPVLVGTNREEWRLFIVGDPKARRLDEASLSRRIRRLLASAGDKGEELAVRAISAYRRVAGSRGAQPLERWIAFQSDRIFHYPAVRLADVQSAHQPQTYAYLFEWRPPLLGAQIGACHGIEIPFVFDTLRHPLLRPLWGSTRSAYRLAGRIQDAWLGFARDGSPAHRDLPEWPAYTMDRRSTMGFASECSLRDDPHRRGRSLWDELIRNAKLPWLQE
jgi:para-nitrobenzyl esterase